VKNAWTLRIAVLALLLVAVGVILRVVREREAEPPGPAPIAAPGADAGPPHESRLLAHVRQLTFAGRRSGEGYFGADGSEMIFQSEREEGNPFYQIYVLDRRTGESRRLSPGHGKATCGFLHPDGRRALFASTHLDPRAREKEKQEIAERRSGKARRYAWDFDDRYDLFEVDRHTGALRRLTEARGYDAEASYSPDGKLIAFASNRAAYQGTLSAAERARLARDPAYFVDLYAMNADGTGLRRLTTAPGYDGGPFFSPDGRRICFRRFSADGATAEIFTVNVDGSGERQLTRLGAMSWAPYFHPSGDYLVFATNRHGLTNFELYLVDAEGAREPVRVTTSEGFDGLPAFSPDGRTLAWTSNRTPDRTSQIFLADWNDAEARRLLGLAPPPRPATPPPEQRAPDVGTIREVVGTLASPALEGRLTGTEGERKAAAFVAARFRDLGLEPAGEGGTYFQDFPFVAGTSLGPKNRLRLTIGDGGARDLRVDVDFRPLAFSATGTVAPAGVVFAGYGIVSPATKGHPEFDSYAHLEVAGRWVMVLRYLPEGLAPEARQHLARYSHLRYKATVARDRKARGLLVVSGPNAGAKSDLVRLRSEGSLSGGGIPAISISDEVAGTLLAAAGKNLKALQDVLDSGKPLAGFLLPGVRLAATIDLKMERREGRNVLARMRGSGGASGALLIGAHLDHLGTGLAASSLARDDDRGAVHPGADDNASGVAGLLEVAATLVRDRASGSFRPRRSVIFAAWSGEELGMLGSSHFVRKFCGDACRGRVAAYLNLDMVGRLRKSLVLQGVGSSREWPALIESANAPLGVPITVQLDAYLPTDATAFYLKGAPILNAFTGAHAEYHTPRDTAESVFAEGVARVAGLFARMARALAERADPPAYQRMEPPKRGPRRGIRAYLGTIPDYAGGEVRGVRLSGVAKGGPADAAGVRGGDVVVELAGRKVENLYDYTYALDTLKVGVPVEMTIVRGAERLRLKVTPRSRE
jgi:Tol biopolymer transport system component